MLGIPYKGTGPALNDLVGGQVQIMFVNPSPGMPYIKSGRLRTLAITSTQESVLLPGLTTVSAAGVPGYESVSLDGTFAPANTHATIIQRLNQEIVRALNRVEVKEKFLSVGAETVGSSPEQLSIAMRSEMVRFGKLIKEIGIRGD
jgi:tripartite-type tricarboxylate transporter receptor subunit TctC